MRTLVLSLLIGLTAIAGCLSDDSADEAPVDAPEEVALGATIMVADLLDDVVATFTESIVTPAVNVQADLYEPTLDVSNEGTLYIAGHTIGVDTTGAPAYFSTDDGATWAQLPFAGPLSAPSPIQYGSPGPSDEIFIVAGDDGWAYGADITAATFPITFWSGNGAEMAYHNPNAFSRVDGTTQSCDQAGLNDRPWAAYANGTLLLANNGGSGYVQIAAMAVPPAEPAGAPGNPVTGPTWNTCASEAGSYIPGIPDIRDDGLFAVPNIMNNERLTVVLGNAADVFDVRTVEVFPFTNDYAFVSVYGQATFDTDGDLFIAVTNNTAEDADGVRTGQFKVAVSQDGGETFLNRTFVTGGVIESLYIDGNIDGAGALAVWAVPGDAEGTSDWYIGHLQVGSDGAPVLESVALAVDDGPRPSPHVTGAAVGPDGRAYLAMYDSPVSADPVGLVDTPGGTPLSVYIQQDGPTLPVTAEADVE